MSSEEILSPEERLRQEIAGLPVGEILALCYTFQNRVDRLKLYLDVLRRRGGERAQFASCLLCFDLARKGEKVFQQEFAFLSETIRDLSKRDELAEALVQDDPYLSFLWELCLAVLDAAEEDAGLGEGLGEPSVAAQQEVAAIDLLSDADFADFDLEGTDAELYGEFLDAVDDFLGVVLGMPTYDPHAGFRVQRKADGERVEKFLLQLDSLRQVVPGARGYRALVLLFYGSQMRSKSLFGVPNQRKQEILRKGLLEFLASGAEVWNVAGIFATQHADPDTWSRIADVLLHYARWLSANPDHATMGMEAYDPLAPLPPF